MAIGDDSPIIFPENIPSEIKNIPHWINWRYETREGKLTKPPINPKNLEQYASATDSNTWADFDLALKNYLVNKDRVSGVGFVLDGNGLIAFDFDHCLDDEGKPFPQIEKILNKLHSYTEITPSGRGLRVLVKGDIPFDGKSKHTDHLEIEVYKKRRFVTITGNIFDGYPQRIEERREEVIEICKEIFGESDRGEIHIDFEPSSAQTWALVQREIVKHPRIMLHWTTPKPEDRSGHDWRLVCLCVEEGITDPRFLYQIVWNNPHGKARAYPNPDRYIKEIVQKCLSQNQNLNFNSAKFPRHTILGLAKEFSDLYSEYLESPWAFFAFSFLTCLGAHFSDRITLQSEIKPQPRMFTFLIGESADDRKSESIKQTVNFFIEALESDFTVCFGVGSAEGLVEFMKKNPRTLLVFDEAKTFVSKANIEASVLLPCVNTLFETNRFHSHTKGHSIQLDQGFLSILGASTKDTFQRMWTPVFTDIGFINRLWLVHDHSERRFPIPREIPQDEKNLLKEKLKSLSLTIPQGISIPITPEGKEIFSSWYMETPRTIFTKRLDTYGHRLMALFCVNENKKQVTGDITQRVIELLKWQEKIRSIFDPIDAESRIARTEEAIRRTLRGGPLGKRELGRRIHYNRIGVFVWETALKNLMSSGEILFDQKKGIFMLRES